MGAVYRSTAQLLNLACGKLHPSHRTSLSVASVHQGHCCLISRLAQQSCEFQVRQAGAAAITLQTAPFQSSAQMAEPEGSHPSISSAAELGSIDDGDVQGAEQPAEPVPTMLVAPGAATTASSDAARHVAASMPTRKRRKKRRPDADASRQPAANGSSGAAPAQRGAVQNLPFAVAAAAVIVGGALLLRRLLLRRPAAQQRRPIGGHGATAADAKAGQRSEGHADDVVDVPVVGAPPALVMELEPPLRSAAQAHSGAHRPLDGLTFAVSDVYVRLPDRCLLRTARNRAAHLNRCSCTYMHDGCFADACMVWNEKLRMHSESSCAT